MLDRHPRNVLDDRNYLQYLVLQARYPILAGKHMPVWPGVDDSARTQKAWAKIVMCSFVPWDIEEPSKVTWNGYLQWEEHCKPLRGGACISAKFAMHLAMSLAFMLPLLLLPLKCRMVWVLVVASMGCPTLKRGAEKGDC